MWFHCLSCIGHWSISDAHVSEKLVKPFAHQSLFDLRRLQSKLYRRVAASHAAVQKLLRICLAKGC